jgi:Fe-S cluster assembly protein SufD
MHATEAKDHYLAAFSRYTGNGAPGWLNKLREAAIGHFARSGFPTTHHEDWKYTSVEPITSTVFEPDGGAAEGLSPDVILPRVFADPDCNRLVFVNGVWSPELSSLRQLPPGARVESLSRLLKQSPDQLAPFLTASARQEREAFFALNTAFMRDGAVVLIPQGATLESPLQLLFVSRGGEKPLVSYPRTLVVAGAGSEVKLVEAYVGIGPGNTFTDAVTELIGGENSVLDYYRVQRDSDAAFHVGAVDARLSRNCNFTAHTITLGGALVRNDFHVGLDGEGGACELNGIYLLDGEQHVDNHTEIEHKKPRTKSFELYKGILRGRSHGVFNGKIVVHKDAQKTDSRQINKNLLLSEQAAVNTKPQLEIFADDVKCSHGSTVGQLDPDALFYLRSRGMDLDQARSLLSYGFASDVIGRVKIASMRSRLDEHLLTQFGATEA